MKYFLSVLGIALGMVILFTILTYYDNIKEVKEEVEAEYREEFSTYELDLNYNELPKNISKKFIEDINVFLIEVNRHSSRLYSLTFPKEEEGKKSEYKAEIYANFYKEYLSSWTVIAHTEEEKEVQQSIIELKEDLLTFSNYIIEKPAINKEVNKKKLYFKEIENSAMEVSNELFYKGISSFIIIANLNSGVRYNLDDSEPVLFLSKDYQGTYSFKDSTYTNLKAETNLKIDKMKEIEEKRNIAEAYVQSQLSSNKITSYEPKIGMYADEVYDSSWGYPDNKNTYKDSSGGTEVWFYPENNTITFKDGKVIAIN